MKKKVIQSVGALLVLSGIARAGEKLDIWPSITATVAIVPELLLSANSEARLHAVDSPRHYRTHTDFSFSWLAKPWLVPGVGFRQIYKLGNNSWKSESRGALVIKFIEKTGPFTFSERIKGELRFPQSDNRYYSVNLKNLCQLKSKVIPMGIRPYIGDEFSIVFRDGQAYENQVLAGIKVPLISRLDLNVNYAWVVGFEKDKNSKSNVIEIGIEITR